MIENGFESIIQKIVNERGKDILLDAAKFKPLLLDYTKNDYKKENSLFLSILNADCVKFINMTDDLDSCKTFLINRLEEECNLSPVKSSQMLDILFFALSGIKINNKPVLYSNMDTLSEPDKIKTGGIIPFGGFEWRVLDIQNGKALILSENVIEIRPYNTVSVNVTWESCTLRNYLNSEFLEKFNIKQQERIAETLNFNKSNYWYGTSGGMKSMDKIFLFDLEEADKYFGNSSDYVNKRRKIQDIGRIISDNNGYYFTNIYDSERVTEYNHKSCWWWLRSPGGNNKSAACVYDDGGVNVSGFIVNNYHGGVRPALWLKL